MKLGTVAILSTGEMGHMIARVLIKNGLKVVTCLQGRSERTQQFAQKAGVSNLPTIQDVVATADIIVSVVGPAAVDLASAVADVFKRSGRLPLFADANAISPMTSKDIEGIISAAGGRYVDASIVGHSSNVGKDTMFYVSGQDASDFAQLKDFGLSVQVLGGKIGQASAFKMVYAGFTKGLCCLMLEQLLTARAYGIFDQIVEKYRSDYPETMAFTEWLLPGYPFRADRRGFEMKEVTKTIEKTGIRPFMAPGSAGFLRSISDLNLRAEYSVADEAEWKLKDVVDILYSRISTP